MTNTRKPNTRIRKDDKNFRRDVSKAKMQYRKKRASWFLLISTLVLVFLLVQIYFSYKEKKELETQIASQQEQKLKLENESKANELVISKLRDPYFITDLVRQEYSMSYSGEVIFNLPLKENYMQNAVNSIMTENMDEQLASVDPKKQIIDENIESLIKLNEVEKKQIEQTEQATTSPNQ